jgi:hypothetical protein
MSTVSGWSCIASLASRALTAVGSVVGAAVGSNVGSSVGVAVGY